MDLAVRILLSRVLAGHMGGVVRHSISGNWRYKK